MQIGRIFLPSGNVQNLPKQNELGVRPSAQYLLTLREDIIYQNTLYVNMRIFFNNLMLIVLELFCLAGIYSLSSGRTAKGSFKRSAAFIASIGFNINFLIRRKVNNMRHGG